MSGAGAVDDRRVAELVARARPVGVKAHRGGRSATAADLTGVHVISERRT